MGTAKDSEVTKKRIIEAAGKLFAENGLKGVTVRTIVTEAKTHLSALNYHFQSKESLYYATLLNACESASSTEEGQKLLMGLPPNKALLILVKDALKEYSKQSASNWEVTLINRECRNPGKAFDKISETYLKPEADCFAQIIANAVGKKADDPMVGYSVIVLFALLEMFGLYGHLVDFLAPETSEKMTKKDWLPRQIVRLVIEAAKGDS